MVVWKPFSDKRQGKLIGFGQCKTGTHWKNGLYELVPDGFCRKWVRTIPAVKPLRLYFITSLPRGTESYDSCVYAGIFFDRCCILDSAPKMAALQGSMAGMDECGHGQSGHSSAMRHRLHALCPYFAMFPESFAETWIGQLSKLVK